MSVFLRKLPKIGLSVVPAFAYIPPLRSGTATPPLLSLPRSAAVRAGAHVNKRVLRSKISQHNEVMQIPAIRSLHLLRRFRLLPSFCNAKTCSCIRKTQPHIFNFFIISKISTFIRNTKILCYENTDFICAFIRDFVYQICAMKKGLNLFC